MRANLKLLKRLYLIDHYSGEEYDMISFILNYCYKIPNLVFSIDKECNLFITKKSTNVESFPCIVAHMDTVQFFSSARELIINKDIIYARYINTKIPCGLNADDCNGILVALQLLEVLPDLKVCFTTKEEVGGKGAIVASDNIEFFGDVRYLIQADRRGNSDIIIHSNGIKIASPKFIEDFSKITSKYNYEVAKGLFTDVGELTRSLGISSINVSCGYYNEHTKNEYCNISELNNCLNLIYDIIINLNNEKFYYIDIDENSLNRDDSITDFTIPCDTCSNYDCMHCSYAG